MKYKKSIIMLVLAIFIFAVAGVSAADVNDTIGVSEDNREMLSIDEKAPDNLKTVEDNNILAQKTNVGLKSDSEILCAGEQGNYSDLRRDIANGGSLTKSYYIYCDGDGSTIEITTPTMVIDGRGAIIDMAGFNIQAFNVSAFDVTIKNLTIINANYTDNGGAIIWNGANGTIFDCNFTNNFALLRGGAIYWQGANGTVNNCNFISNTVKKYSAGAIQWVGTNGTLSNCNFKNNTGAQKGGAIFWQGTNGLINNCEFLNSTSLMQGGAIFWDPNAVKGILNNSIFINNLGDEGGAIYWFAPNGLLNNCNFTNNTANTGGAVNWQRTFGTVNNCNFINNTAEKGGAIYWEGTNGTLNMCKIINTTSNEDGAVYWLGANGTINGSDFISNAANNGGAVNWVGTNGTINNCNFTNNNATQNGGAVYFDESGGKIISCDFTKNSANMGGAIFFKINGTVQNSNFENNFANISSDIFWGDIAHAKVKLSKSVFTYNAKVQKPTVKVTSDAVLKNGVDYTLKWSSASPKKAGTYTITVVGMGIYAGSVKVTFKINKASNPLKVKARTAIMKFSKLKKKTQTLKVTKVVKFIKKGQGTLAYKKVSGNKKITINKKNGKVTVKKGLKKGTYKVKVKIKAKGNANYKASAFKTIIFKIKIK